MPIDTVNEQELLTKVDDGLSDHHDGRTLLTEAATTTAK